MEKKKKVYIIMSYTGSIFSKFLRIVLKNKFVHVSIGLDKQLQNVYSFGRKRPRTMFPGGFVKEDINKISHIFKNAECQIFELEITEEQYKILKREIRKFTENEKKYGYNIFGLIPLNFNIRFERKNHFVCSQFVGRILQEAGIYNQDKNYSLIKPNDISKIYGLNKVYEGKMTYLIDKYSP